MGCNTSKQEEKKLKDQIHKMHILFEDNERRYNDLVHSVIMRDEEHKLNENEKKSYRHALDELSEEYDKLVARYEILHYKFYAVVS